MFQAWLLDKASGTFQAELREVDESRLPPGDVLVQVLHSTINYKDALALTHRAPVVRNWPMVPGIDGAGIVLESRHAAWKPGDRWILNGWGSARRTGDAWPSARACAATGWSRCRRASTPARP